MGVLSDILQQSILKFLWIGSFAGILVGVGLLFKPQQLVQVNQYLSRWIGSDKLNRVLDRPRWIDRLFYRHHRLLGASVFVGAMAVLYIFLFHYNLRTMSAIIPRGYWWLSDAVMGMLLVGSVFAAFIGAIVLTRPSLLRDFEKSLNRWISTEYVIVSLNTLHKSLDQSLTQHNRLAGISIFLGSLYVLVVLGSLIFSSGKLQW